MSEVIYRLKLSEMTLVSTEHLSSNLDISAGNTVDLFKV